MKPLPETFFERAPVECAPELIGKVFRWGKTAGIIVETEAYAEQDDPACHTFDRPSARDFVNRNRAGTSYVYINYGMYWLMNVLCKCPRTGNNGFVLLRALEPTLGIGIMKKRRQKERETDLCSGPGKLSMALGIGREDHEIILAGPVTRGFFEDASARRMSCVLADRRVGISRARELPWRFLEEGNPHVSVPFGKAR